MKYALSILLISRKLLYRVSTTNLSQLNLAKIACGFGIYCPLIRQLSCQGRSSNASKSVFPPFKSIIRPRVIEPDRSARRALFFQNYHDKLSFSSIDSKVGRHVKQVGRQPSTDIKFFRQFIIPITAAPVRTKQAMLGTHHRTGNVLGEREQLPLERFALHGLDKGLSAHSKS